MPYYVLLSTDSLSSRTVKNVSFIGLSQIAVLGLMLLTAAVLARILTPVDFGIVSIGMVFIALFTTIQDFGVLSAVVQRDTKIEESIGVAITLRWLIATISLVIVVSISPFLANFYGQPGLAIVLVVLSTNLFIQPISFSSLVLLTRGLRFRLVAISTVVQYLAITGVSITLAYEGFSYWSIVFGSLSGSVVYVVSLRYFENTVVRPSFDKSIARELLGFGAHLLVVGIMSFVIFNVDQLVVGKVLGVAILGVYYVAVRFGRTLGQQISGTVNAVLFPTMARIKESSGRLKTGYTQSLRMIAIIAVPLSVGMAALSPMFVHVVLGGTWSAAAFPIAVLSIQGLLNALIPPSSNVLIAMGKPHYMSAQATVQAVALLVAIYPVAVAYGINGVSALTTMLSLGVLVYFLIVFSRVFESGLANIAAPLMPPLASGLVTFVLLTLASSVLPESWISLLGLAAAGSGIYLVCLHVASRGRDLRDFLGLLWGAFPQRRGRQ
jgi:PST family polysaccharide transporter